VFGQCR